MVVEIRNSAGDGTSASDGTREIIDWRAGSPVYLGEVIDDGPPPEPLGVWFWLLKPGDIVCDWFNVSGPDNRGLLRMMINLTLYAKIVAIIVVISI